MSNWIWFIIAAISFIAGLSVNPPTPPETYRVFWSDGDSGTLISSTKGEIRFKLHAISAPETYEYCRGVPKGKIAAKKAQRYNGRLVRIKNHHGNDKWDRRVVKLALLSYTPSHWFGSRDQDLTTLFIDEGIGKPWNYDDGQPRPDHCETLTPTLKG